MAQTKEQLAEYQRRYRAANPDKVRAHSAASYQKHRAQRLVDRSLYVETHKDSIRATNRQAYLLANPEKRRAYQLDWQRQNRPKVATYRSKRRAVHRSAPVNDFTTGEWLILKDEFAGCCAYCGNEAPLEQEHMQPLSRGGSNTYTNIVPACRVCNARKGTTSVEHFMAQAA